MFHMKPNIKIESESKKGKIKIMGYPAFGKVKTLVLPYVGNSDGSEPTLKQYKELTGIDLKKYLVYDNDTKTIGFKFPANTQVFIDLHELALDMNLQPVVAIAKTAFVSGTSDCSASLLGLYKKSDEDYYGLVISNQSSVDAPTSLDDFYVLAKDI